MQDKSSESQENTAPINSTDIEQNAADTVTPIPLSEPQVAVVRSKSHEFLWTIIILLLVLLLGMVGYGVWQKHHKAAKPMAMVQRLPCAAMS